MEYLQQLDQEVFLYLNHLGTPTWDWFWVSITHEWMSLPLYALVSWLMYKKIGVKNTAISLILLFLMVGATYGLTEIVKMSVMRPRPCNTGLDIRFLVEECGTDYSFFSTHASAAMAIAIFTGFILKPYYKFAALGMVIWALFMAYSRIYVGKHFPGDVLVGSLVGLGIGLVFLTLQRRFIRRFSA